MYIFITGTDIDCMSCVPDGINSGNRSNVMRSIHTKEYITMCINPQYTPQDRILRILISCIEEGAKICINH